MSVQSRPMSSLNRPSFSRRCLAITLVWACLLSPGVVRADEGLWTFDNFPTSAVRAKYGAVIDATWLSHVQGGSARLSGGCSSSIVSALGLAATNQHCVSDCLEEISSPKRDFLRDGFMAGKRQNERRCFGLQADVLVSSSDVSERIARATDGKGGEELVRSRGAAIAAIETDRCPAAEADAACEVVSLYQGGQYRLYVYHRYSDVRLVFAPELRAAFFGGDPDNFNFPRYALDVAFVRFYENGAPAHTPRHLRWTLAAPKMDELVFVSGAPGTTSRSETASQLRTLHDVVLPQTLLQYSELRGRLAAFGERGPEQRRIAAHELIRIENSLKGAYGEFQALSEPHFLDAKAAADDDLSRKVAADPMLAGPAGDPWADIARIQPRRAVLSRAYSLLGSRAGFGSLLLSYGRDLVRAAQERAKPSGERLPEYADARLNSLERRLLGPRPVDPALERLQLAFWLAKVREYLSADAPETKGLLGRDSPEALAARLSRSRLWDAKVRRSLWEGGLPAIEASRDPMIRYVLSTDADMRRARQCYEEQVTAPTLKASTRLAAARFAAYGSAVYPDATATQRLSYGVVAGWTRGGAPVAAFTTFKGLWERATGSAPFDLAPRWAGAERRLNPDRILDFVTTNDSVGGNSGSPVINLRGQVIGIVFDANIFGLGGAYGYDGAVNRTVAVSTAAVTDALRMVYGQDQLVEELATP